MKAKKAKKAKPRKRKCKCCREWFRPQPHNAYHQRYCTEPECRRASKRASQQKYLRKYYRLEANERDIKRVRRWRKAHPGYWRRKRQVRRHGFRISLKYVLKSGGKARFWVFAEDLKTGALRDFGCAEKYAGRRFSELARWCVTRAVLQIGTMAATV